MSPTIRVDDDVFAYLQKNARPLVDNPNAVLRRLFELDTPHTDGSSASPSGSPPRSDTTADVPATDLLHARGPDCSAIGRDTPDAFYVLKGSLARKQAVPTLSKYHAKLRHQLLEQGVLVEDGRSYRFATDWSFGSASAAACVVLGGSANGLRDWQDDQGRSLGDLR